MSKRKLLTNAVNLFKKNKEQPKIESSSGKFEVDNLSVEDFKLILKYGKSSDTIGKYKCCPFVELPYGLIKRELPNLQKQAKFYEMILLVLNHQYRSVDLSNATGNELMAFLLWLKEQQERLNLLELNYLSSDPDPKMVAAGIHQLNELGELPTIDSLAGNDILKYEAIEALPYFRVYEKLKLEKIMRDINKRYEEIIKNTK